MHTKTRQRDHWETYALVFKPLADLYNTEFDPWSYDRDMKVLDFVSNPTWEAAAEECNRRAELYRNLVPVSKWGIA